MSDSIDYMECDKMTCENCQNRVTYQELDDNLNFDQQGRIFHVCMLTDEEVELTDDCEYFLRRPRQPWETVQEWEKLQ